MGSFSFVCVLLSLLCLDVGHCRKHRVVFVLNRAKNSIESHELYPGDPPAPPEWIVKVDYTDNIETTGWIEAGFTTNTEVDVELQAYGAGYADGQMSATRISQMWNNTLKGFCDAPKMSESCIKIEKFIQNNLDWMLFMIKQKPKDRYWKEVKNVLLQLQGLEDGFNTSPIFDPTIRLKPFGLLLMQLGGDILGIQKALGTNEYVRDYVDGEGSGSGLVKLIRHGNGKEELLTAHATWSDYNRMLRIIKRFNFGDYSEAFSGYPGMIYSGDNFYVLSSGLVIMDTSLSIWKPKLWDLVTFTGIFGWVRNIVANRLADAGAEWSQIFMKYSGGTCNKQWMIVDYKEFDKQSPDGILYHLEEIPGEIVYEDKTVKLGRKTYWASYDIPYFPKMFNDSGFPSMVKKYGDYYSHLYSPREDIIRRTHTSEVTDIPSMIKLMRYNDFINDPLSNCSCNPPYSAQNAFAARSDLNKADGEYPFPALAQRDHGAIDVKVTSSILRKNMGIIAETGPTHDQQSVFQWSTSPYKTKRHAGHPDKFGFKPELFVWDK